MNMTHKRYTVEMQRLYEHEVMTFLNSLPDKMVQHHLQLTQLDTQTVQVRHIWKRRADYTWLKFLFNEQELQQTAES